MVSPGLVQQGGSRFRTGDVGRGLCNRMTTMRRESVRAWKAGPCVRNGCWVWRCVRWLGAEYWAGYRDGGLLVRGMRCVYVRLG